MLMLWYFRMGLVSERLVEWTGHTGIKRISGNGFGTDA